MKKGPLFTLILLGVFCIISCKDEEDPGLELLTNNELELGGTRPEGWFSFESPLTNDGRYSFDWSTEEALSGERSLMMTSRLPTGANFASWVRTIPFDASQNIGRELTFSVWIRGDLTGTGSSIAIRGDGAEGEQSISFETTQGRESITGEFEWEQYEVSTMVEEGVTAYQLFLIVLPQTTGDVFFDDVSLIIKD